MSIGSRAFFVVLAAVLAVSCDRLTMLVDRDLSWSYAGDDAGAVDRASVASDEQVIASAKRLAVRATAEPTLTEIHAEETHFVRGTLTVVYTGRLVFHCKTGESWCRRVGEATVSGTRPRDVFRKWPSRINARGGSPI
jgi:hypothetical protein